MDGGGGKLKELQERKKKRARKVRKTFLVETNQEYYKCKNRNEFKSLIRHPVDEVLGGKRKLEKRSTEREMAGVERKRGKTQDANIISFYFYMKYFFSSSRNSCSCICIQIRSLDLSTKHKLRHRCNASPML